MSSVNLNQLRDDIHKKQKEGSTKPSDPKKKLYVDSNAGIKLGKDVGNHERAAISEVQPDTFEASRLSQDRKTARTKMPANTREIKTNEGVTGWLYGFRCELGRAFQMFAYFDGSNYQVKVVSPEIEAHWKDAHTGHIYANGNICFGGRFDNGRPTLEEAYAKSVLWATGISIAMETGSFPFNHNQ